MHRSRRVIKRTAIIDSGSDSEDDIPLKKLQKSHLHKKLPTPDKQLTNNNDSSSESDIENYLQPIDKIDLNSSFFTIQKKHEEEFKKIEKDIFAGVTRLSDSDSDEDMKEEEGAPQEDKQEPSYSDLNKPSTSSTGIKLNFQQLEEYTKKIEEAKKHIDQYNAKKRAEEHNMDISNILAAGEAKNLTLENIKPEDLHSSDFESCDSEQEDWEEVKVKESQEIKEKTLVPKDGVQITVDMPETCRTKKGIDLLAAMKRRLNRIRKENQVYVHKVHLLCWIAHGNYVNEVIGNSQILALALSLLPSDKCYPSDRTDLSYLEQITQWYKRTVKLVEKPVPKDLQLINAIQLQINRKEVYNKKNLVYIFIAILRALGIQCRLVLSFQVEPIRPPASELHSLAKDSDKKDLNAEKNKKTASAVKQKSSKTKDKKDSDEKSTIKSSQKEGKANAKKNQTSGKDAKKKMNRSNTVENDNREESKKKAKVSIRESSGKEKSVKLSNKTEDLKKSSVLSKVITKKENGTTLNVKDDTKQDGTTLNIKQGTNLKPGRNVNGQSKDKDTSKNVAKGLKTSEKCLIKEPTTKKTKSSITIKKDKNIRSKSAGAKTKLDTSPKKSTDQLTVKDIKSKRSKSEDKPKEKPVSSNSTKKKDIIKIKFPQKHKSKDVPQVDGTNNSSDDDISFDITNTYYIPQLDGADDNAKKPKSKKVNLKKLQTPAEQICDKRKHPSRLKTTTEAYNSENEFRPRSPFTKKNTDSPKVSLNRKINLQKLKKPTEDKVRSVSSSPKKQLDVKNDIINLIKGRIVEQKYIDRSRIVKKRKPVYNEDDDSDSDYMPEPIKKKHHDSDSDLDYFVPKPKVKQRISFRKINVNQKVLSSESDADKSNKKKRKGVNVWVEVFLENEEKWISVDVVQGQVHCVNELYTRATHPVCYIVAWDNDNFLKDITMRYCKNFNTITRKLRVDARWWEETLKPFRGRYTAKDKEEDDDLNRQQLDQPLPKSIAEYKNHPLYALRRHLLKFEDIYPPDVQPLGYVRGEPVYPRNCVYVCRSRDIWLKEARVVKPGEKPYKIVKARPKYDKLSNQIITDQLLEIFGEWQTMEYEPPTAENGVVPRNAFGNVELFKPCMLPKGTVHLQLPGLNKICRRMNIDCASAIVGFDFHAGWSHPTYDGFVVCEEFGDMLVAAWELEQEEIEKKENEKIEKRVYGNWKKLIRGLLIRERLKVKYDFGNTSVEGGKEKKKAKGPRFCTKKRRVYSDSESESDNT